MEFKYPQFRNMSLEEITAKLAKAEKELQVSKSQCEQAALFGQQLLAEKSRLQGELAAANETVAKERKRCQDLLAETVDIEERCERDFAEQQSALLADKEILKKQLISKQTEATSLRFKFIFIFKINHRIQDRRMKKQIKLFHQKMKRSKAFAKKSRRVRNSRRLKSRKTKSISSKLRR